jgi:hypothetical protein
MWRRENPTKGKAWLGFFVARSRPNGRLSVYRVLSDEETVKLFSSLQLFSPLYFIKKTYSFFNASADALAGGLSPPKNRIFLALFKVLYLMIKVIPVLSDYLDSGRKDDLF